jgi:GntR family transcriptional regulator
MPSHPFPYQRIVDELRAAILEGRQAPGERLASENELASRYGTSRPTVRRAIALLKAEGLVVSEQGRGIFVRPKPHVRLLLTGASYRRHRAAGVSGFNAQAAEQGQKAEQRLLEVVMVAAPPDVAIRLDIDEGAPVVVRRRLFLVEEEPAQLCDSYYSAALAQGTKLAEPRRIRGSAYAVIEDPAGPIGRRIARTVDDVVSRMPTPREAEALRMPPGTPVLRVLRTVYDAHDAPVEVQEAIMAADRHELRYEVSIL